MFTQQPGGDSLRLKTSRLLLAWHMCVPRLQTVPPPWVSFGFFMQITVSISFYWLLLQVFYIPCVCLASCRSRPWPSQSTNHKHLSPQQPGGLLCICCRCESGRHLWGWGLVSQESHELLQHRPWGDGSPAGQRSHGPRKPERSQRGAGETGVNAREEKLQSGGHQRGRGGGREPKTLPPWTAVTRWGVRGLSFTRCVTAS